MSSSEKRTREETSPPRETVSLPTPEVIASKSVSDILENLKTLMKETSNEYKHPVITGSRAAAYWLPSFRSFEEWDIVATPNQTCKILENLQGSKRLKIVLIRQPLDKNIVRRTPDVEDEWGALPDCLYKVLGELDDTIKFEIEVVPVNQDGSLLKASSAAKILNICNNGDGYLDIPIGSSKCVVASLEVLEALKSSQINWPAHFDINIADLHTLRALIPSTSSNVNIGVRADKKKPLTFPERTVELEDLLFTRTLETEAFHGTPGAHINLNVFNDGREDDLSVGRHILHNGVHLLVRYGDIPSYLQESDSSKAMGSQYMFEKAPYYTQLKGVKEEARMIALEQFLLPQLAFDYPSAYKSALIHICTASTKVWLRQFAIDNFPRLAVCDKDLLFSVRDDPLTKNPLPLLKKTDPIVLLKQSITNLEELVLIQKLVSLTRVSTFAEVIRILEEGTENDKESDEENEEEDDKDYEDDGESDEDDGESEEAEDSDEEMYTSEEEYYRERHSKDSYWIIYSSEDKPLVLVSFINASKFAGDNSKPSYAFNATLSIQVLDSETNLSLLEAKIHGDNQVVCTFNTISAYVSSETLDGSLGDDDIWGTYITKAQHLEGDILKVLDMEGLTEDLFIKFITAVVQPKLLFNGDTPLQTHVYRAKSKGLIPVNPQNHLWYDLWRYDIMYGE